MQTQNSNTINTGVVINKSIGFYTVCHHNQLTLCRLSSKLWRDFKSQDRSNGSKHGHANLLAEQMDPVAIGDHVTFIPVDGKEGMIVKIAERRNYLARRSAVPMPGAHAFEQVIAANLDQVVPIFAAADPEPKWHMLDRYLVTAESYQIPSIIVITKLDLVVGQPMEKELLTVVERYQKIGYPVILTSAKDHQGLDEFRHIMANRTSVLVGKSGVGKSTLLNELEPDLGLRVQEVSQSTGKGRHTTTHLEMFTLATGGAIIDTPGAREFGLWGLEPEDIADYFLEMRPLLGLCKFGLSCQHEDEPGCAIRKAVMDGEISPYRYKSYLQMKADM
jgi:ribosome biogenesis GTPase